MARNEVSPLIPSGRRYPHDRTREVFEAAKSGDAVLLSELLKELNSSQRAYVLKAKTVHDAQIQLNLRQGCGSLEIKGDSTPLIVAAGSGNLDCVKILLKYKADVENRGNVFLYKTIFHKGFTSPLIAATANGHVEILSVLLENGADVNTCTNDKYTPLMIASLFGHVNVVQLLVQHGANTDLQDKDGYTAFHHAVFHDHGSCDLLSCLIENKLDVNALSNDNCTPLMIASENNHLNAVSFLIEHGANIDLQDENGYTAVHYAVGNDCNSCDVLSCLLKNGANVDAGTNNNYTPLMVASDCGNVDVVNFLIQHGADIQLRDKDGKTALHYAVHHKCTSFDVLSSLIKNGGDIDACRNDNCTPLMIACCWGHVNVVAFLIERGANIDLQDKNGDTALHYAVRGLGNSTEIVYTLMSVGASQLCNNKGLTPLLLASNYCKSAVVEELIKRPECTKEQKVNTLELLGASFNAATVDTSLSSFQATRAFCYIKRGMEERFADPFEPMLKQPMEPVQAYQNRKESQTLEELAQIEGDINAIIMENLIIRERILGTNNAALLEPIRTVAGYYKSLDNFNNNCIELYRHAMKIAQRCNQSAISDLHQLTCLLYKRVRSDESSRQDVFLELFEQIVLEYERQTLRSECESSDLFDSTMKLVTMVAKYKYCEEAKTSQVSVLLKRVFYLNPRNDCGDTLLHNAVDNGFLKGLSPCPDTVKLLLNEGVNVNAVNNKGETPLHKAVTHWLNAPHHLADILKILLDGGAHHDFVNNRGKTAMDMAETDEARRILSDKRKLELKCISARAVKRFGLPYLGMVPKTLEKYISMH